MKTIIYFLSIFCLFAFYSCNESDNDKNFSVGDYYGGGVIIKIDSTNVHGLIVSMIDLSKSIHWSNITASPVGIGARDYYDGYSNSIAIVNQENHTNSAAKLCLDYTNSDYGTGIFDDWFLPSLGELNEINAVINEIQKRLSKKGEIISSDEYWSSYEIDNDSAMPWDYNGNGDGNSKRVMKMVRAIRKF